MLESMEQVSVLKEKFFQLLFRTLQDKQRISTVLCVNINWSVDAGRRAATCVGVNIVKYISPLHRLGIVIVKM